MNSTEHNRLFLVTTCTLNGWYNINQNGELVLLRQPTRAVKALHNDEKSTHTAFLTLLKTLFPTVAQELIHTACQQVSLGGMLETSAIFNILSKSMSSEAKECEVALVSNEILRIQENSEADKLIKARRLLNGKWHGEFVLVVGEQKRQQMTDKLKKLTSVDLSRSSTSQLTTSFKKLRLNMVTARGNFKAITLEQQKEGPNTPSVLSIPAEDEHSLVHLLKLCDQILPAVQACLEETEANCVVGKLSHPQIKDASATIAYMDERKLCVQLSIVGETKEIGYLNGTEGSFFGEKTEIIKQGESELISLEFERPVQASLYGEVILRLDSPAFITPESISALVTRCYIEESTSSISPRILKTSKNPSLVPAPLPKPLSPFSELRHRKSIP